MSKMKIKNPNKKKIKKQKMPEISLRDAAFSHLNVVKTKQHVDDEAKVAELIANETLDIERRCEKKYMESIARGINWKVGKLESIVENMVSRIKTIESAIKKAQTNKASTEAQKEKKDE